MDSHAKLTASFSGRWWELPALRAGLAEEGRGSRLLGHSFGPAPEAPEYAFLAADVSAAHAQEQGPFRRSVVLLKDVAVISFLAAPAREPVLEIQQAGTTERIAIRAVDIIGTTAGDWAVLFHNEPGSATSAVSFDVPGSGGARFLVTGLAPGLWQVWRNGWLEDIDGSVRPSGGALYFESRRGNYFLRRTG